MWKSQARLEEVQWDKKRTSSSCQPLGRAQGRLVTNFYFKKVEGSSSQGEEDIIEDTPYRLGISCVRLGGDIPQHMA